jgi:hypothetical protein
MKVLGEHHLQQRQQQVGVPVGNDAEPFEPGRGLGLAWIDDKHPAAAFDDVVHPVADPRDREHAVVGDDGVRADDDQEVGAQHVRDGQGQRGAVKQLAGHESVVDVLRARGEKVRAQTQPGHQHGEPQRVGVAERARVAEVPADRAGSVRLVNVAEPVGDVGHGRVPADGLEGAFPGPAQRRDHPVGVVLNLGERDAFLAGEARRQRVITVRPQQNSRPSSTVTTIPHSGSQMRQNVASCRAFCSGKGEAPVQVSFASIPGSTRCPYRRRSRSAAPRRRLRHRTRVPGTCGCPRGRRGWPPARVAAGCA